MSNHSNYYYEEGSQQRTDECNQNVNSVNFNYMPSQSLPQRQRQMPYIVGNQPPTICNDHHSNIVNCVDIHEEFLILSISQRMLLIKDYMMKMNQLYVELEQDFIKLRRGRV